MSWSYIGGAIASSAASVTKSVTTGNLICVGFMDGTASDTLTISDGVNTWTRVGSQLNDATNSNSLTWWWASAATTASITATVSGGPGPTRAIWLGEWNSTLGSVPSDSLEASIQQGVFTNDTGSTATDGDTSTNAGPPASNGDLIIGWIVDTQAFGTGSSLYTAGTSFTERAGSSNDSTNGQYNWAVEDRTQTTAAAAAGTWTAGSTAAYGAFVGFFKEAAAAGGAGGGASPAYTGPWAPLLARFP